VAAEHDAVVEGFKAQIKALEEERNELRSLLHTESETQLELRQELSEERTANQSLLADLKEIRRRGEASLNILTASLLAAFGVAIAAVGYSKCQEPEL
jgi:septal ring factor EnvC (AmiA/AmiB activator)